MNLELGTSMICYQNIPYSNIDVLLKMLQQFEFVLQTNVFDVYTSTFPDWYLSQLKQTSLAIACKPTRFTLGNNFLIITNKLSSIFQTYVNSKFYHWEWFNRDLNPGPIG